MTDFRNRKFLLLLMLAAAVFFLRVFLPAYAWVAAAVSAVIAVLFFALGGGFAKKAASIIFAAFTLAFTALPFIYGASVAARGYTARAFVTGEETGITAAVADVRFRSAYASSYVVDVRAVDGEGADFRAVLQAFVGICDDSAVVPEPPKGKWLHAGEILGDHYSVAWRV